MLVRPLVVGHLNATEQVLYQGGDANVQVPFVSYMHFIETEGSRIVVDTGFGDLDFCRQTMPVECSRSSEESVDAVLSQVGCSPSDIDTVILTHCHWDHIGGIGEFPNAKVYCQRAEFEQALRAPKWAGGQYPQAFAQYLVLVSDQIAFLNGDSTIEKGITVRVVGGHSPASHFVELWDGRRQRVVITGDVVFYYSNLEKGVPVGSYSNIADTARALTLVEQMLVQDPELVVFAGHDPATHDRYRDGVKI